jgi:hypothetical protein
LVKAEIIPDGNIRCQEAFMLFWNTKSEATTHITIIEPEPEETIY